MRIALVRHPAPAIAPGICYGRLPVGLARQEDAVRLAGALAGFAGRLLTSPAMRCRLVADAVPGGAAIAEPRLAELDFGAWEGLAWEAVPRRELDAWAAAPLAYAPPGGESVAALIARCTGLAGELVAAGEDCILISHGGPLRVLPALLRGLAPDPLAAAPPFGTVTLIALPAR